MFMRMDFKQLVPMIDLEGSPRQVAWNIFCEFEKQLENAMLNEMMKYTTPLVFNTNTTPKFEVKQKIGGATLSKKLNFRLYFSIHLN
jgi:hypothetical protein